MNQIKELHRWHRTRVGMVFFGLMELIVAYLFASWAIDSANLWAYFFTFVFLLGGIQNLAKAVHIHVKGGSKKR